MYRPDVYGLASGEATLTVSDGSDKAAAGLPAKP
jgi:hypothetical protein